MNKRPFKSTEAQILEWKQEVVNYLRSLLPESTLMNEKFPEFFEDGKCMLIIAVFKKKLPD